MAIKNIIFDLGGVILDIDYHQTVEAFRKLGAPNFDALCSQTRQNDFFDDYEIGKVSSEEFRDYVRKTLNLTVDDGEFDKAWNAMLLDLPKERFEFIKNLRKKYKIFLYSNTNEIHLKEIFKLCERQHGFNTLNEFFDKQYYSCEFGRRKPHPESFLAILEKNGLKAEETLFVDDSIQHIMGAKEAGLNVIHFTKEKSILMLDLLLDES